MTVIRRVNTKGLVERPNGSALNWYTRPLSVNLRYLRDRGCIGTHANRRPSDPMKMPNRLTEWRLSLLSVSPF